jgi:DNA-binding PadR family transcriptional regulator
MSPRADDPPELNQTARVVLGMLAEGHTTGYAIKSEIERSTRLFWGASAGGIYPELRRLTEAGLVTVRDDPRGETRRHCYSLTEAGAAALRAWLDDEADEPALEMRNEQLLRLRFAGVLAAGERRALLRRMRALHADRAQEMRRRLERERFDDAFDRLTARYALDFNEWAAGWAAAAEAEVADEP